MNVTLHEVWLRSGTKACGPYGGATTSVVDQMQAGREAAGIHDFDEGPEVLNVEHRAFRDTVGRYLILLLRALERQLSGAVETVMANLFVIDSSAARENSVFRILVEEAVARLMGITDVIFIHAENTAFGPDSRAAAIETAEARIRRSIPVRGRRHFEGRPTKLLRQFGNSLDKIRKASLGARSVSKDSYERPIKRRLPCAGVQPSNQRQRS